MNSKYISFVYLLIGISECYSMHFIEALFQPHMQQQHPNSNTSDLDSKLMLFTHKDIGPTLQTYFNSRTDSLYSFSSNRVQKNFMEEEIFTHEKNTSDSALAPLIKRYKNSEQYLTDNLEIFQEFKRVYRHAAFESWIRFGERQGMCSITRTMEYFKDFQRIHGESDFSSSKLIPVALYYISDKCHIIRWGVKDLPYSRRRIWDSFFLHRIYYGNESILITTPAYHGHEYEQETKEIWPKNYRGKIIFPQAQKSVVLRGKCIHGWPQYTSTVPLFNPLWNEYNCQSNEYNCQSAEIMLQAAEKYIKNPASNNDLPLTVLEFFHAPHSSLTRTFLQQPQNYLLLYYITKMRSMYLHTVQKNVEESLEKNPQDLSRGERIVKPLKENYIFPNNIKGYDQVKAILNLYKDFKELELANEQLLNLYRLKDELGEVFEHEVENLTQSKNYLLNHIQVYLNKSANIYPNIQKHIDSSKNLIIAKFLQPQEIQTIHQLSNEM